jgi:hypothetical protein
MRVFVCTTAWQSDMKLLIRVILSLALFFPDSVVGQEARGAEGSPVVDERTIRAEREARAAQAHHYRVQAEFARARVRLWQWLKTHLPGRGGIPEGWWDDATEEANEIAERFETAARELERGEVEKPTNKAPPDDGVIRLSPVHIRLQCGPGTGECMYCWCKESFGAGPGLLYPIGWRRASACLGQPC